MAHWAELDEDNVVLRVLVGDNNDPNGDEGYQWLLDNLGGTWVKTSYNANLNGFRKNFASIGYTYNQDLDAFIPPQPYPSWILDEINCQWTSPTPYPEVNEDSEDTYVWDEESLSWVLYEI
jgi:hypothetical protein